MIQEKWESLTQCPRFTSFHHLVLCSLPVFCYSKAPPIPLCSAPGLWEREFGEGSSDLRTFLGEKYTKIMMMHRAGKVGETTTQSVAGCQDIKAAQSGFSSLNICKVQSAPLPFIILFFVINLTRSPYFMRHPGSSTRYNGFLLRQ